MKPAIWSPLALEQLWTIVEYIWREDPSAAWSVHDRIVERVERLSHFPELGPPGRLRSTRQLVITGTPYVVVYQLTKEAVLVLAVWHSSQSRRRRRLH